MCVWGVRDLVVVLGGIDGVNGIITFTSERVSANDGQAALSVVMASALLICER